MPETSNTSLNQRVAAVLRSSEAVVPRATYRLQFHKDFTFEHAIEILPYLKRLGISHVYASPLLMARSGSTHGYDIIDHNRMNPELGGEEGFQRFSQALKQHGLGLLLDFVPNHMGVGAANRWWRDVLKHGRCSRFAHYFDIDWNPLKGELRNKLLLPTLGEPYGQVLESGNLQLKLNHGEIELCYYDHSFPVALNSLPLLLDRTGIPAELLQRLRDLPEHCATSPSQVDSRLQLAPDLERDVRAWLSSEDGSRAAPEALKRINGSQGAPASFDRLHQFLEAQPYRLSFWRVSGEEINYRRFFDVNDLVGVRQEFPDVFASTHRLIRRLLGTGQLDGIRIDHVDGLYNPRQYLIRLQMLDVAARLCGPQPTGDLAENGIELSIQEALAETQYSRETSPLYCLVEKILEPGEQLPEEWPVHGTSGYEFMNLLNGIFIETAHAQRFTNIYERFTGLTASVADLVYSSKKLIMHIAMSSEVYVLTNMLAEISASDRYARDFTQKTLRDVIRETIACFPVYRTYIDERGEYTTRDRGFVETAIRAARRRNPGMNASVFSFFRSVLLLEPKRHAVDEAAAREDYRRKLHFALKFQQLTGPVMAKGLEDTVCYIYNRFISVNEVGGSPEHFGISLAEFHAGNQVRATTWPNSMLASSTHDTKRSEDVRARLNVLSEIPTAWSARALRWRRLNKAFKVALPDGRVVPDLNEEYLLYQTIVGSCPLNLRDADERERYIARMQQYMAKALHEGKVNLSWLNDDPEYVEAMNRFIGEILSPTQKGETAFVNDLLAFLPDIAYHGAMNSISQTLLKLTAPGVPDTYQGTDLIDLSLVDPDNRRPVDYSTRLREFAALEQSDAGASVCHDLLHHDLPGGKGKMFVLHRALRVRGELPAVFAHGQYVALTAHGERTHNAVAFMRKLADDLVVVVAPRFTYTMMRGRRNPPVDDAWGNTLIEQESLAGRQFQDAFTSEMFQANERGQLPLRDLCRTFPFVLLRSVGR